RPSKRLGQNFLLDQSIASEIVPSIRPSEMDTVLEPGPGHGTLTRLLREKAGKVVAVEKDPFLVRELRQTFKDHPNVVIVEGDVLKISPLPDFNKIVSTPPYYLSSKLALFLSKSKFDVAGIVFQKEFGERLLAEPGTKETGRRILSEITLPDVRVYQLSIAQLEDLSIQLDPRLAGRITPEEWHGERTNGNDI